MNKNIRSVCEKFDLNGKIIEIKLHNSGLINNTYYVKTENEEYIIQKINNFVFKKPDKLMKNINIVTKYIIERKGNTLEIVRTYKKNIYYKDINKYYRCYKMKKGYKSYDLLPNAIIAYKAGLTMGEFQNTLSEFNLQNLYTTIPFFHDLRHRYIDLIKSYRNNDNKIIKEETVNIIQYLLHEYKNIMNLPSLIEKNIIPKRVCHYDTKLNNFLFSDICGNCLIDLDTVMPGCSIYDFGDCARNIIFNVEEDDVNSSIVINLKTFIYLLIGYLSIGKNYLTKLEVINLVNSIKVIALELSIRFLNDYIDGNKYFKISYEKQNLNRSICQLNIYKKICEKEELLNSIVNKVYKRLID